MSRAVGRVSERRRRGHIAAICCSRLEEVDSCFGRRGPQGEEVLECGGSVCMSLKFVGSSFDAYFGGFGG
jgi:hypothetical protein